jgi:hypothetical protein
MKASFIIVKNCPNSQDFRGGPGTLLHSGDLTHDTYLYRKLIKTNEQAATATKRRTMIGGERRSVTGTL